MKQLSSTDALKVRLRAILTFHMIAAVLCTYIALLIGVSLARYWPLIQSSIEIGNIATAQAAFLRAVSDLVPEENTALALTALVLVASSVVLMGAYLRKARVLLALRGEGAIGLWGILSFVFGLGCLSCGAAVGAFLATLFGASIVPALLAWGGEVLAWGGVAALGLFVTLLAKKLTDPLVC